MRTPGPTGRRRTPRSGHAQQLPWGQELGPATPNPPASPNKPPADTAPSATSPAPRMAGSSGSGPGGTTGPWPGLARAPPWQSCLPTSGGTVPAAAGRTKTHPLNQERRQRAGGRPFTTAEKPGHRPRRGRLAITWRRRRGSRPGAVPSLEKCRGSLSPGDRRGRSCNKPAHGTRPAPTGFATLRIGDTLVPAEAPARVASVFTAQSPGVRGERSLLSERWGVWPKPLLAGEHLDTAREAGAGEGTRGERREPRPQPEQTPSGITPRSDSRSA